MGKLRSQEPPNNVRSDSSIISRISTKVWTSLFFLMAAIWGIMIYYTVVPWVLGYALPANKSIDVSVLTWVFVGLSLVSTIHWFFVQIGFMVIGNRAIDYQRRAIIRSSLDWTRPKPLVSIIIPARNEEAVITRTVSSCLLQTYKNIEVLVICHNCTDRTYATLAQLTDDRVRAFDFKTKKAGKGLALDFAVENAQGDYVLVLDSDGTLNRDFVTTALPLFDSPNIAAVQGKLLPNNRHHNTITELLSLEGDLYSIPHMTMKSILDKRTSLGGTGYIIRKDILQTVGGFKNSLIDDFELSFRLFRHRYRIAFAPLSVSHDERPPELGVMIRQRSRWVKGHVDLVRERVPESSDIMGNIYWLNPVLMLCGLSAIAIVSFGIFYYLLFGTMPYKYSTVPILIWIGMTVVSYFLQLAILIKHQKLEGLRHAGHLAISPPFSQYWYVTLIKAFFVKSWASTKTTHGYFTSKDMVRLAEEQHLE
jgi:cellulose synthase/poly-beta-1,6-N-acetylglucosamine synthase-like glycosyltransferase